MKITKIINIKLITLLLSTLVITACGGEQTKNSTQADWQIKSMASSNASLTSTPLQSSSNPSSSSSTSISTPIYSGPTESKPAMQSSSAKTLSFSEAGPIYLAEDKYFRNPADSDASGSITYTSSNVNVATINEDGYIQVINKGTAVITATQEKNTASYTLTIVPKSVNFAVWINGNNEEINIPSELNGGELYMSDSVSCTYSNYQGCRDDQKYIIDGSTIIATKNHSKSSPHVLFHNNYWALDFFDNTGYIQPVVDHAVFVFNEKLWSLGGRSKDFLNPWRYPEYSNDLWSTIDGVNWTRNFATSLPSLTQHQVINFNNALWLFGGTEHTSINDLWKPTYKQPNVWSSIDGINWVKASDNSASFFCGDTNLVVFNNKLWRFGGCGSGYVYSTVDGTNWVQEPNSHAFLNRSNHRVTLFKNKLLLIGGIMNAEYKNDVWSSEDGVNWVLVKEHAEFSERQNPSLTSMNNRLLLAGGSKEGLNYFDTWSSSDGINWSLEGERSQNGSLILFKNQLWTIGGYDKSNFFEVLGSHAISKSNDGTNWWHLEKRSFDFTRPFSY
jgi:Bacterial Ig-like domain (group 2)